MQSANSTCCKNNTGPVSYGFMRDHASKVGNDTHTLNRENMGVDRPRHHHRMPRWLSWLLLAIIVFLLILGLVWLLQRCLKTRRTRAAKRDELNAVDQHPVGGAQVVEMAPVPAGTQVVDDRAAPGSQVVATGKPATAPASQVVTSSGGQPTGTAAPAPQYVVEPAATQPHAVPTTKTTTAS